MSPTCRRHPATIPLKIKGYCAFCPAKLPGWNDPFLDVQSSGGLQMGKEALNSGANESGRWTRGFAFLHTTRRHRCWRRISCPLFFQSRASKKLIALQHSEATAQEAEIARLKKETASFDLDIATAKEGAAKARSSMRGRSQQRGARRGAQARLKLEALLAPRRVFPANKKAYK